MRLAAVALGRAPGRGDQARRRVARRPRRREGELRDRRVRRVVRRAARLGRTWASRSAGVRLRRRRWSSARGLALVRDWPEWVVGLVLAFGAGALISRRQLRAAQESFDARRPGHHGARPRRRGAHVLPGAMASISGHQQARAGRPQGIGRGRHRARARSVPRRDPGAARPRHRDRGRRGRRRRPARRDLRLEPPRGDRLRERHAARRAGRMRRSCACGSPSRRSARSRRSSATPSRTARRTTSRPSSTGSRPGPCS